MTTNWYCSDCERRIDRAAIDSHEAEGPRVCGVIRPNRLLGNDPWSLELPRHEPSDEEVDD